MVDFLRSLESEQNRFTEAPAFGNALPGSITTIRGNNKSSRAEHNFYPNSTVAGQHGALSASVVNLVGEQTGSHVVQQQENGKAHSTTSHNATTSSRLRADDGDHVGVDSTPDCVGDPVTEVKAVFDAVESRIAALHLLTTSDCSCNVGGGSRSSLVTTSTTTSTSSSSSVEQATSSVSNAATSSSILSSTKEDQDHAVPRGAGAAPGSFYFLSDQEILDRLMVDEDAHPSDGATPGQQQQQEEAVDENSNRYDTSTRGEGGTQDELSFILEKLCFFPYLPAKIQTALREKNVQALPLGRRFTLHQEEVVANHVYQFLLWRESENRVVMGWAWLYRNYDKICKSSKTKSQKTTDNSVVQLPGWIRQYLKGAGGKTSCKTLSKKEAAANENPQKKLNKMLKELEGWMDDRAEEVEEMLADLRSDVLDTVSSHQLMMGSPKKSGGASGSHVNGHAAAHYYYNDEDLSEEHGIRSDQEDERSSSFPEMSTGAEGPSSSSASFSANPNPPPVPARPLSPASIQRKAEEQEVLEKIIHRQRESWISRLPDVRLLRQQRAEEEAEQQVRRQQQELDDRRGEQGESSLDAGTDGNGVEGGSSASSSSHAHEGKRVTIADHEKEVRHFPQLSGSGVGNAPPLPAYKERRMQHAATRKGAGTGLHRQLPGATSSMLPAGSTQGNSSPGGGMPGASPTPGNNRHNRHSCSTSSALAAKLSRNPAIAALSADIEAKYRELDAVRSGASRRLGLGVGGADSSRTSSSSPARKRTYSNGTSSGAAGRTQSSVSSRNQTSTMEDSVANMKMNLLQQMNYNNNHDYNADTSAASGQHSHSATTTTTSKSKKMRQPHHQQGCSSSGVFPPEGERHGQGPHGLQAHPSPPMTQELIEGVIAKKFSAPVQRDLFGEGWTAELVFRPRIKNHTLELNAEWAWKRKC
ncbi:unnamed protein product [Amoebophrya sp. A25]|nr:unnamed protein product [Amoebophrya sp. A25]|eukprot:GSA25T00021197001.1